MTASVARNCQRLTALSVALMLSACAHPAPLAAQPPCPPPEMMARKQAKADEWERYSYALKHTADGSRAYGYFTYDEFHHPVVQLMLLVRPDGGGTLYGGIPRSVELSAAEIAPVETAVSAAGFPALPGAAMEPGAICFVAEFWRDSFEAARDGQQSEARGNECGSLADSVSNAGKAMVALAKTHGGLLDRVQSQFADQCPIAVKVSRFPRL